MNARAELRRLFADGCAVIQCALTETRRASITKGLLSRELRMRMSSSAVRTVLSEPRVGEALAGWQQDRRLQPNRTAR